MGMAATGLTREEMIEEIEIMEEIARRKKYNSYKSYQPYPKQVDFHRDGLRYAERLLGAGNQTGKTYSGAHEAMFHATGLYPDDWVGARFENPTVGWVGGVSGEVIRDTTQKHLVGRMQDESSIGSMAIPKDCIIECARAQGVKDLLDHVKVKHISGGVSLIFFKSYEKGRAKFQGETIDWVWLDEEPPEDIYAEALTRTNSGQLGQFLFMTFTPLLGMTNLAFSFYMEPSDQQHLTLMSIDDVDHYTEEEKVKIKASYKKHEREARAKGLPVMGSGRIFAVAEEDIEEESLEEIPRHWLQINGLDFGWDHPQACVNIAWDRDADVIHVRKAFRKRECLPLMAAHTIKKWGKWIPCAWPHDGHQHDKGSGAELAGQYREAGLTMLEEHATHEEGGYGVEAGLMEMLERMETGRLKVDKHLADWFEEFRMYHREKGKIIKDRDDLMCATRYAIMMLRFAVTAPIKKRPIVAKAYADPMRLY